MQNALEHCEIAMMRLIFNRISPGIRFAILNTL